MTDNTDERLGKSSLRVARRTAPPPGQQDRELEDREVTENREISEDERVEMFRMQNFQSVLPDLPKIPGWHICWLSTTHPSDTIQRRQMLGYEPVKPSDVPGMDLFTLTTGDYQGMVGVKEMVAFKLPESLYQKYMMISHHEEPMRQQEGIVANIDSLREQAAELQGRLIEGDGISDLRKAAPRPRHFA